MSPKWLRFSLDRFHNSRRILVNTKETTAQTPIMQDSLLVIIGRRITPAFPSLAVRAGAGNAILSVKSDIAVKSDAV